MEIYRNIVCVTFEELTSDRDGEPVMSKNTLNCILQIVFFAKTKRFACQAAAVWGVMCALISTVSGTFTGIDILPNMAIRLR